MNAGATVAAGAAPGPWLRDNAVWLLMAATLALFATETLFNVPFWLLAAAGLCRLCRAPRATLADPHVRLLGMLFLCLWVPQMLSLPDAVNRARSAGTAFAYVHFFLAGVFVLAALRDPRAGRRLELALFCVITLWTGDALLQYAAGTNLLGYPSRPGQLTGMFHPKIRLGHLLAVLLPVYVDFVRRQARGRPWLWLLPLALCAVVFLSGKRVAWLMATVAAAGYALYLARARAVSLRALAIVAATAAIAGATLLATNPTLARRAAAVTDLFSGDLAAIDRATSHRLPLWEPAWAIASDRWINGVGPRGYRYVFRDYAAPDNFFLRDGREGQTHPHQLVLEVAAETGLPGIAGLLAFWWLLLARVRRLPRAGAMPWFISGVVAWLPLNAHLAFYGSYWSSVSWWVLLLALAPRPPDHPASCPAS
jgi:O-antigen ligase